MRGLFTSYIMNEKNPENYQKTFMECYEAHSDSLFRYCLYKTSDREKALDLTQDAFMKTWEYIEEGNKVKNLKSLLFTIANNLIIDFYRKKKSVSLDSIIEEGIDFKDESSEDKIDEYDIELVKKILEELDEGYRDVIIMRYIEDMSIKEIAKILGETENNISVKVHRGIAKVKEKFNKINL